MMHRTAILRKGQIDMAVWWPRGVPSGYVCWTPRSAAEIVSILELFKFQFERL